MPYFMEMYPFTFEGPKQRQRQRERYQRLGCNPWQEVVRSLLTEDDQELMHWDPWRHRLVGREEDQPMRHTNGDWGVVRQKDGSNSFQVMVDVKDFDPKELEVKLVDGFLTVEGKHEEKTESGGYSCRQFCRTWSLPQGVKVDSIRSALRPDGQLAVEAPIEPQMDPKSRTIPITFESKSPANEQQDEEMQPVEESKVSKDKK